MRAAVWVNPFLNLSMLGCLLISGCTHLQEAPARPSGTDAAVEFRSSPDAEKASEQLLVVTGDLSDLPAEFSQKWLPKLKSTAEGLGIGVLRVDSSHGVPAEIHSTPAWVYQNHLGRSIYQGRWNEADRFESFLLTARHMPQEIDSFLLDNVLVMRKERLAVVGKIKITDLAGEHPDRFVADAFREQARQALQRGFDEFEATPRVELVRSDRTFYFDAYPYRGGDGSFYLSLAMYSQFNCVVPVFSTREPLAGTWESWPEVFTGAASVFAAEVQRVLEGKEKGGSGDAIRPVSKAQPEVSWDSLGYPLPSPPKNAATVMVDREVPTHWSVTEGQGSPVLFRFAAPLDNYNGYSKVLRGHLTLGAGGALAGARGSMEVPIDSVTMGNPELDHTIHGEEMLAAQSHPTSRLTVRRFESEYEALAYGRTTTANLLADFELRGVTVDVAVPLNLDLGLDAAGQPRLRAQGSLTLRLLEPFGIQGPDGPSPARDTVSIRVDFVMSPTK